MNSLIALGITPRKTKTLEWPKIPDHLYSSFCLGYFDGDGCWYIDKKGNALFTVTGCYQFINAFQDHLIVMCKLKKKNKNTTIWKKSI